MMENVVYIKSMEAKLILEQGNIPFYQELMDVCASHKGVRTRVSFKKVTVSYKRKKIAVIKLSRKNISLFLALDPANYANYNLKDVSNVKAYKDVPAKIKVKSARGLKRACFLLDEAILASGATKILPVNVVDYSEKYAPKSFDELVAAGLIKVRVTKTIETHKVNLTCRLVDNAINATNELYVVTNLVNWELEKAILMNNVSDNQFEIELEVPHGYKLEFKVLKGKNWNMIEKGIWNEEIVNHNYLVEKDLNVVDLIHNFE